MSHRRHRKRAASVLMEKMISSSDSTPDFDSDAPITQTPKKAKIVFKEQEMLQDRSRAASQLDQDIPQPSTDYDHQSMLELVAICQAINLIPQSFLHYRFHHIANTVKQSLGKQFTSADLLRKLESIQRSYSSSEQQHFGVPSRDVLWETTFLTKSPHLAFLGPPVTSCIHCSTPLETHNRPCHVVCYGFDGPIPAQKIINAAMLFLWA